MKKKFFQTILFLVLLFNSIFSDAGNDPSLDEAKDWLQSQLISFLENKGQVSDMQGRPVKDVLFKASAKGCDVYITTWGLTYVFSKEEANSGEKNKKEPNEARAENKRIEWARTDMRLEGASIQADHIIRESPQQGETNYYLAHCPNGVLGVKSYGKITITEVYKGIDWVIYSSSKGIKYDFIVHPGADPENIRLVYQYADVSYSERDGLEISTPIGQFTEQAPVCYEKQSNKNVKGQFQIEKNSIETKVGFKMENFNNKETLVIDPMQLIWGTYLGGQEIDWPLDMESDADGNIYVTGQSGNVANGNWPVPFPLQDPGGGAYFQGVNGVDYSDVFITKFSNNGNLLWSTYYGGSESRDDGNSIAIDNSGNVYVAGLANSHDFPLQDPAGGAYFQSIHTGPDDDAFILKFDNNGVRLWCTYYGGYKNEICNSIAVDNSGNLFVTGVTNTTDLPVKDAAGGAYFKGTFSGTNPANYDAFILKFSNTGALLWATYYGGVGHDGGNSVAVDNSANVIITGVTESSVDFPVTAGAYQPTFGGNKDIFISKFNNDGVLTWSTYFGGSGRDEGNAIAVDNSGNFFITGLVTSLNFPLADPGGGAYIQPVNLGTGWKAFVLKFTNTNNLFWSTYYGGSNIDWGTAIAVNDLGEVYVTGNAGSADFPRQDFCEGGGYYQPNLSGNTFYDAFILKFTNNGKCLWSTLQGDQAGTSYTEGTALTIDPAGCLFLAEVRRSWGPGGLLDPAGGAYYQTVNAGGLDGFILKFCGYTPIPVGDAGPDVTICMGASVQMSASGFLNYQWIPSTGISDPSIASPIASPASSIDYIVSGIDTTGCEYSDTVNVFVGNPPVAGFTPLPTAGPLPLTVTFSNSSQNADSYLWLFGDGMDTTETNPVHVYRETGSYTVTLVANNVYNCPDTAVYVRIKAGSTLITIPNAFTPEGSGTNERFMVYVSGEVTIEAYIYDRWGEELYRWNTTSGGWDGTYKGKPVQEGVYTYLLKVREENSEYTRVGSVALLR